MWLWFLVGFVAAIVNLHAEYFSARGGYKFSFMSCSEFVMFTLFGFISPIMMAINMFIEFTESKFHVKRHKCH